MQNHIKTIVFPTDFSETAALALGYAGDIASKYGAELHLVSAVDPQIYAYAGYVSMLSPDEMLEGPKRSMQGLPLPPSCEGLTVHRQVVEGYVDEAIADFAKHNNADLIVMSSHTRGRLARFFLGSVADRVMAATPCPMLLLRGSSDGEAQALPNLKSISKIIAPCDFSYASEQAIARAVALAKDFGASVHVVHVLDIGSISLIGVDFDEVALKQATKRAADHLAGIVEKFAGSGVTLTQSVVEGDPSEILVDYAKTEGVQLFVMGNSRRSEFGRLFLGSVTDAVARETHLPVWIEPVEEKR